MKLKLVEETRSAADVYGLQDVLGCPGIYRTVSKQGKSGRDGLLLVTLEGYKGNVTLLVSPTGAVVLDPEGWQVDDVDFVEDTTTDRIILEVVR